MTTEKIPDPDEKRLAALLRTVETDRVPVDEARLLAMEATALAAFLANEATTTNPEFSGNSAPVTAVESPRSAPTAPARRSKMLALLSRGLLAVAATIVAAVMWLNPFGGEVRGAVMFGQVLDRLRSVESLQFQLQRQHDGQSTTALVSIRMPGLIRLEHSPQRYEIATGSRWWQIDETENSVIAGDSPWFRSPQTPVDLLALLNVGVTDASPLWNAVATGREEHAGRICDVFRVELPAADNTPPLNVEALADVETHDLVVLRAFAAEQKRSGIAARPQVAQLELVAINAPMADEQFVVSKSLSDDGRIGKVSAAQGVVVLRPALAKRWTPVCRETILKPGDWLRVEHRGPNAVKVLLTSSVELTVGPGSLLECLTPTQARLHNGQVQVHFPPAETDKTPSFTLLAPRLGDRVFHPGEKQLLRVGKDEKLVDVPAAPVWLTGFEGTSSNESLGSLIVNLPDGRNEPLTVGYHKMSVEIRDQIARTTIEESFVNHTAARLEGVFHFPLPQDASISGFGMWIGNDLVEADVVEKQRAREIYETILRERRDPGLLEWTSGNLFKARVFPIEPHSEKRVKIVYTQVLPLRGERYRYTYNLRSDLLQTKPLRELSLNVTIQSALSLKNVSCSSHPVRTQKGAHAAQVEFTAQEYLPTRDFEVVCELDRTQADVVAIPHRRGDDGYLLVQLSPPGAAGNWQRELLPDGQPLNVVLLCDTSASMDSEKRKQQNEFITTVLASLGKDDRFQLAACDVGTTWAVTEPTTPSEAALANVRQFLDERLSLGWTNLDRAFQDVIAKAPTDAHVIYIGDGIVSSGDTDATNFVKRLNLLIGTKDKGPRRTFHAVGVGSINELVALRGIALTGGGSVRMISGEQTPAVIAMELLNEVAQPGLRDLKVEFQGVKVAAVYPERLPNLPAGTQQILTARYLPTGADQQGTIIVTGKRGTETVRFATKIDFKDAEAGNSFIPRLWARSHLDHLLNQGSSPIIRDEIISLSEQFHIITPYTSLLVLETDADRERFGVKRRYEMRDGERFFAEGRDAAQFELLQQHMQRAGEWRQGLRRQALLSLRHWGRDARVFQEELSLLQQNERFRYQMPPQSSAASFFGRSAGRPVDWYGRSDDFGEIGGRRSVRLSGGVAGGYANGLGDELSLAESMPELLAASESDKEDLAKAFDSAPFSRDVSEKQMAGEPLSLWDTDADLPYAEADRKVMGPGLGLSSKPQDTRMYRGERMAFDFNGIAKAKMSYLGRGSLPATRGLVMLQNKREIFAGQSMSQDGAAFPAIFPHLPGAPQPERPLKPETWSPEAIALSNSLLRTTALAQQKGGLEVRWNTASFDPRWQRQSGQQREMALVSPQAWLARTLMPGVDVVVNFCRDKDRGVFSSMLQLGQQRTATDTDRSQPPLGLNDFSLTPLHHTYHHYAASLQPAGENQTWLVLDHKDSKGTDRWLIDTARHVLRRRESLSDGKRVLTVVFDDFVEIEGRWWARKVTQTDDRDRVVSQTEYTLQALSAEQFQQRMTTELAILPQVQFVTSPLVSLKKARQAVADGRASFDDHWRMLVHQFSLQQWDEVDKHLSAIEALAVNKPGVRWLRIAINGSTRRKNEARLAYLAEARKLADAPQEYDLPLCTFVLNQSYNLTAWNEFLELVEVVKPVYVRQPADRDAMSTWNDFYLRCLDALQRKTEALELARERSAAQPWHIHWQTDYASRLFALGQTAAAYAWLQQELDRKVERPAHEDETLRMAIVEHYRQQARWGDLLEFTTSWMAREPESQSYYSPYAVHLSAMVYAGKLDAAYALADQWLLDAQRVEPLPTAVRARLDAALNFANGNAYQLSFQRMQARWHEPLATLVRYYLTNTEDLSVVQRAVSHYHFTETDTADVLRGEWLRLLQSDAARLSPAKLQQLVGWTLSGRMQFAEPIQGRKQLVANEVPDELWTTIAATVEARWQAAEKTDERHSLGETRRSIYATRFRAKLLPFLRTRLANAAKDYVPAYRSALFEELLTTTWTAEIEAETWAMLPQLTETPQPFERLQSQVPLLYRWVDAMVANRQAVAVKALEDAGQLDKLTRQELSVKKTEFRSAACRGVAAHLAEHLPKEAGPLAAWMKMERLWLLGQLGENIDETEAVCWVILGEVPPVMVVNDDDDETPPVDPGVAGNNAEAAWEAIFRDLLQQRALTTVMQLATRRQAPPASVERLLKYLDAGLARNNAEAEHWRQQKLRLLIALDRPDELDRQLREWIRTDGSTAPWRVMLAHLLAERGQLAEAITLFEAAEKDQLLSHADYQHLADWYLVMNRRADTDRAKLEAIMKAPEYQLAQVVQQSRYRWMRTDLPLPTGLEEATLLAYRALFKKSANPENYLSQLREHYTACRDFRLLQMVPEAMLGRSPQQVYAFIQQVRSQVLYELRNEATADEIVATIAKLRTPERTPTDLRALDILEAVVERQSSEVLNQPGPHVTAAVAALQRAFAREWQPGEPVLMAQFLYDLGGLPQPALKDEQLRELRVLQQQAQDDPRAHLQITQHYTNLLGWSYTQMNDAIREMEAEVRDYALRNEGRWPHQDNEILGGYVRLLEGAGQHAAGESVLTRFRDVAEHDDQRRWFDDRVLSLYNHALEHQGTVSLGSGDELFAHLVQRILRELETAPNENVRQERVTQIVTTFNIAHRRMLKSVNESLRAFAFTTMPKVLAQQQATYRNTAQLPLATVITVLGPVEGLRYAIERVEQYPPRLEIQWDNAWNAFGYELARQRDAAASSGADIAAFEERLLKLAVERLQRDLRNNEGNSQYLYYRHYGHFWSARANDFAAAAEAVLMEQPQAGRRAVLVANYLRNGLDLSDRAIEVLLVAHRRGVLDEVGQAQLVNWLENANRFAEMIPLLEPLVSRRPDTMIYRTLLMLAYQRSSRPQQMREVREGTDAHFHQGGRWTESNIALFAQGCLRCKEFTHAVNYYQEAVALHQRASGNAPMNDGVLSDYYSQLANAHAALGHTREAVDAASGAIVCWGPRQPQRDQQLRTLDAVIAQSRDLDVYVTERDRTTAETGQDSPLIRKAIGKAYQSRNLPDKALKQFQLALELQPFDKELQQAMIVCYDALKQPDNAARQLLKLLDFDRHDLALYQQLAERYRGNEVEAERAATSLIEAAPNEAENHTAMAELRQQQDRWDEAIPHWQRVAELRQLEPTGLVKLASAQIHQKQWPAARDSLTRLQRGNWPARFHNLPNEIRQLQEQLPK